MASLTSEAFELGNIVVWGGTVLEQPQPPESATNLIAAAPFIAARSDGVVLAWGSNDLGQTNIPPQAEGVVSLASGKTHRLALLSNGTVISWGKIYDTNPFGYKPDPIPVNLTNVIAIAAGLDHSVALRSNGTVIAWGRNSDGQCNVPEGLSDVIAVRAGFLSTLALKQDGSIVGWGNNQYGQLTVPEGLTNVSDIAAGGYHTLALMSNGTVAAWGDNQSGECNVPPGLSNVVAIAAGYRFSLALRADGSIVEWPTGSQAQYAGTLTNVVGIIASDSIRIAFTRMPVVWPPKLIVPTNSAVTLRVLYTNASPVSYQWYYESLQGFVQTRNPIFGANENFLVISNSQYQVGNYSVTVNESEQSTISTRAYVKVAPAARITKLNLTTNGSFSLVFSSLPLGTHLIETSTDMKTWSYCGHIVTNSGPGIHYDESLMRPIFGKFRYFRTRQVD